MVLYINGNYPNHSLHSELVFKLAELENDITVFVPMCGKERDGLYPCNHPKVRIIYSDCLNYPDKVFFFFKTHKIARIIEQLVDLSKVDCILAGTVYSDGVVAFLLHQKYKIPFSVAVRETDVTYQMRYRPYLNGYMKQLLNQAERVIFLSPTYKRYFKKFGMDQEKYTVIPNAVNDFWFQNPPQDRVIHNPVSLVFIGEISKRKNVGTVISTIAELNKRSIETEFHIVGSGDEEGNCRALAKRLGIEKQVFFHGWQNRMDKIKMFYDQADIFIMLSHRETFGTVYIEAMSQGLPVLYTKGQGIDGYFEEGRVGYACDSTDVDDAADIVMKILDSYPAMSHNCVKESQVFKWDVVAKQYLAVINTMRNI